MVKRALIIAPHPDDEINLAGQLMVYLNKKKIEIFVMYTTNGDSEARMGNKRIQEAINANFVLGIEKDHVIFLGYPNEWCGSTHIYNTEPELVLTSKIGKTQTNSISSHPEFCMLKHGVHHSFTRNNFKSDYKEVIEYILPDLIIAPEFDSHPDHRAASLLFDEIIGEILKDRADYRPTVLKKYIHEGVWYGPKDYYEMLPTQTEGPRFYCGGLHDLDSPSFTWNQRIQYGVEKETLTELISKNVVYKSAKKHKVTTAWYEMQRVINSDIVYWQRRTDNLCLNANITATSGNIKYLNDFKLYDSVDVNSKKDAFAESASYCWRPDDNDNEKRIIIRLDNPNNTERIVIFEDCNHKNHITKLQIVAGEITRVLELEENGSATIIDLNTVNVANVEIRILEWEGIPGIAEIEIFSRRDDIFLSSLLDCKFQENISTINHTQHIEKIWFMLKFLFNFKLKYVITRKINSWKNKNKEQED